MKTTKVCNSHGFYAVQPSGLNSTEIGLSFSELFIQRAIHSANACTLARGLFHVE